MTSIQLEDIELQPHPPELLLIQRPEQELQLNTLTRAQMAAFHTIIHNQHQIAGLLWHLIHQENQDMADLTALTAAVQAETDAQNSAVTLIQNLAAELKNAAGDQNAVNALADRLNSEAASLAAAVTANTPATSGSTGSTPPPATGAPASSTPPASTGTPVGSTDAGAPVGGSTSGATTSTDALPLYKHTGPGDVDPSAWPSAGVTASDDSAQLYHFSGDTAGNPATGASADWTVYTGGVNGSVG